MLYFACKYSKTNNFLYILYYYFSVFHICILAQQQQAYRRAQSAMPDCTPQIPSAHWDARAGLPWK